MKMQNRRVARGESGGWEPKIKVIVKMQKQISGWEGLGRGGGGGWVDMNQELKFL